MNRAFTEMRYYFDIFDGDHWTRDDIGVECRNDRAARLQAVLGLTEMAHELLPTDGNEMLMQVRVRDASHHRFTLKLDFDTDGEPGILGEMAEGQRAPNGQRQNGGNTSPR